VVVRRNHAATSISLSVSARMAGSSAQARLM